MKYYKHNGKKFDYYNFIANECCFQFGFYTKHIQFIKYNKNLKSGLYSLYDYHNIKGPSLVIYSVKITKNYFLNNNYIANQNTITNSKNWRKYIKLLAFT